MSKSPNLLQELNIKTDSRNLLFIGGPTASGKTSLAIQIAHQLQSQNQPCSIISADSRQIYKEMTICTAKPAERTPTTQKVNDQLYLQPINYKNVDHYLFDIVNPDDRYTLFDFQAQVKHLIQKLHSQNYKVIIAGGTGLYIDSLINNYQLNAKNTEDKNYKQKLINLHQQLSRTTSKEAANQKLWLKLKQVSPTEAAKVDKNNWQGVIRALEVFHSTENSKSSLSSKSKPDFEYQLLILNPPRKKLYDHINQRCLEMFEAGLIEETQKLVEKYSSKLPAMTSIGYKQVNQFLNNETSKDQAIQDFQQATRRYAKRQLTWFRRYRGYPQVEFIDSYQILKSK